jgi:hypothetical protein
MKRIMYYIGYLVARYELDLLKEVPVLQKEYDKEAKRLMEKVRNRRYERQSVRF